MAVSRLRSQRPRGGRAAVTGRGRLSCRRPRTEGRKAPRSQVTAMRACIHTPVVSPSSYRRAQGSTLTGDRHASMHSHACRVAVLVPKGARLLVKVARPRLAVAEGGVCRLAGADDAHDGHGRGAPHVDEREGALVPVNTWCVNACVGTGRGRGAPHVDEREGALVPVNTWCECMRGDGAREGRAKRRAVVAPRAHARRPVISP